MNTQKIGDYIKKKRKEKKLTQKELAQKLDITDRAISKWERGICCPDISLLKEISLILNISINELLSGEDIEKLEIEQSDKILLDSVNKYTSIEQSKRLRLWILTICVIIIDIIFIFTMYLMYNQINARDALTINSIQNRYITNKILTLTENENYEKLANIFDYHFNEEECNLDENQYDYICMLKELNDLGVKFISHKNLSNYFNNLDDVSKYELTLKYKDKEEKIEVSLSSSNGHLRDISFYRFIISDSITCNNLDDGLAWCYNQKEFKNYYLYELNLDRELFFPKEINDKIVNIFSPSKYR